MASSSSIANFLSLFIPSKAPPKSLPPTHLSFSSDSAANSVPNSSSSSKNRDGFAPLVATSEPDNRDPVLFSSPCPNDLMSVICPSLAYANTLFFRSAYNVQVIVDDNEPEEKLLNRFRREVMKAGVIQECKRRRFFENKQDKEKRKTREAAKRNRRRRTPFRSPTQDKVETTNKKREDDDDNWDMPDAGSLPA